MLYNTVQTKKYILGIFVAEVAEYGLTRGPAKLVIHWVTWVQIPTSAKRSGAEVSDPEDRTYLGVNDRGKEKNEKIQQDPGDGSLDG